MEWEGLLNLFLYWVVSDFCGWEGCCGLLYEVVCEDFVDLLSLYVYVSGLLVMVYVILDVLVEVGMDVYQMCVDVFVYVLWD